MTTGVCSKTVARGRKIRANPPHSLPPVCVCVCVSAPFRPFRPRPERVEMAPSNANDADPLSAPRRRACCREPRRAGMRSRIRDVQSGRVFARTRHFYDGPSSPLYHGPAYIRAFRQLFYDVVISLSDLKRSKLDADSDTKRGAHPENLLLPL